MWRLFPLCCLFPLTGVSYKIGKYISSIFLVLSIFSVSILKLCEGLSCEFQCDRHLLFSEVCSIIYERRDYFFTLFFWLMRSHVDKTIDKGWSAKKSVSSIFSKFNLNFSYSFFHWLHLGTFICEIRLLCRH